MAAVFVLPVTTAGQLGPVAAMTSAAGWAAAGRRVLGSSWIVTPDGILDPDDARRVGSAAHLTTDKAPTWRRHIPVAVKTAGKDLRQWRRGRRFHVDPCGPWTGHQVRFVWQRHEVFHTAGIDLARALGAPSVLFVPATQVWEARGWGVTRPGWGSMLERVGECPALRAADLVACGSDSVAEQAERLGVAADRILITPTGVDLDLFPPSVDAAPLRRRLGLEDRFVVGWVGSFRPFHAVDQAVDAVAAIKGASLMLVGDGPERPELERRVAARGVRAVFTGTVDHSAMPDHLAAMDVALVLSAPGAPFHYSPLKLAEYLAAGLPVVAPDVPSLRERLDPGVDALLVPPGDVHALVAALTELRDDEPERARMAAAARAAAEARWGWDHQVGRVVAALDRAAAAAPVRGGGDDHSRPGSVIAEA